MVFVYTAVFFGVSVISYHSLPWFLKKIVAVHYLVGFLYNFFISYVIQLFLAKSTATGVAQWFASILFAVYIIFYKKKHIDPLRKRKKKKKKHRGIEWLKQISKKEGYYGK